MPAESITTGAGPSETGWRSQIEATLILKTAVEAAHYSKAGTWMVNDARITIAAQPLPHHSLSALSV